MLQRADESEKIPAQDRKPDLPHYYYPFNLSRPHTWGEKGRTNRMMVERISRLDEELKTQGYKCLVGGDMNFEFVHTGVIGGAIRETPERRAFCNATLDRLTQKFEGLKSSAGDQKEKQDKIDFILKRLGQKKQSKNFNRLFQFCFMAELNRQMHDEAGFIEQNFSWCTGKNNPLSDKPLKPFLDSGTPEFQLVPASPEEFLRRTYQTYYAGQALARQYGLSLKGSTEHVHLSVHKNGENLTTRTHSPYWEKETYHPHYLTLLSAVQHMAKKTSPFLQMHAKPMMVTETKLGWSDAPSIRACRDNIEFRCDENARFEKGGPHLALDLMVCLAGVKLGVDEIEGKDAFKKYGVSAIKNEPVAVTNFQRHKAEGNSDHDWGYLATWAKEMEPDFNSMARDMFHYAHADDHGKLKAHPGVVRQVDEEVKAMCSALKDSGFHSNAAKALQRFVESCTLESENGRENTMRLKLPDDLKVGYGEMAVVNTRGIRIPTHDMFTDLALVAAAHVARKLRFHKLDKVIDSDVKMDLRYSDDRHWNLQPVVRDYIGEQLANMMLSDKRQAKKARDRGKE